MNQDIKIQAFPQYDSNECHFILETPIETFGIFTFDSKSKAKDSELPLEIFSVNGVSAVKIVGEQIIVTKDSNEPWTVLGKEIGQAIRRAIKSGKTLVSDKMKNRSAQENKLKEQVSAIIESRINPALASHGGFIELWDVKENDIYVKMGGGCQGCASSQATLKQGVQNALKEEIPHLGNIYDTTDHAAGTNPYY